MRIQPLFQILLIMKIKKKRCTINAWHLSVMLKVVDIQLRIQYPKYFIKIKRNKKKKMKFDDDNFETDGRKLWLDEAVTHSTTFLNRVMDTEEKRELSPSEKNLKDITAAYLYLYNVVEEQKLLEGTENLFNNQTIH